MLLINPYWAECHENNKVEDDNQAKKARDTNDDNEFDDDDNDE